MLKTNQLISTFLLVVIIISCQPKYTPCKFWSPTPLTIKDYKSYSGQSKLSSVSTTKIISIKDTNNNQEYYAAFFPQESWFIGHSESLFQAMQYHFNLTEAYTRMLRKQLADYKYGFTFDTTTQSQYHFIVDSITTKKLIYEKVLSDLYEARHKYTSETNYLRNKLQTAIWQLKIDSMLNQYQDYYIERRDTIFYNKTTSKNK